MFNTPPSDANARLDSFVHISALKASKSRGIRIFLTLERCMSILGPLLGSSFAVPRASWGLLWLLGKFMCFASFCWAKRESAIAIVL